MKHLFRFTLMAVVLGCAGNPPAPETVPDPEWQEQQRLDEIEAWYLGELRKLVWWLCTDGEFLESATAEEIRLNRRFDECPEEARPVLCATVFEYFHRQDPQMKSIPVYDEDWHQIGKWNLVGKFTKDGFVPLEESK